MVAAVVSLMMTPTYEATATIWLGTGSTVSPHTAAALLKSPQLERDVREQLAIGLSPTAGPLSDAVDLTVDRADSSLLHIAARGSSPVQAADLANAWAREGLAQLLELADVSEDRLATVRDRLREADRALAGFFSENIGEGNITNIVPFLIGYRALGPNTERLQVVVGGEGQARASESAVQLTDAEWAELAQLLRERDVAEGAYVSVAQRAQGFRPAVVSEARPPRDTLQGSPVTNVVVAGGLGLLLGIVLAFGADYLDGQGRPHREGSGRTEAPGS